MRIRVSFEYGAGACLWADDAEARERWCSAVEFNDAGLTPELAAEGEALMEKLNDSFTNSERDFSPRWSEEEQQQFHARGADWTGRVAVALAAHGITVAPYGSAAAPDETAEPEFAGEVVACFADEAARAAAAERQLASHTWRESATWACADLSYRAGERTPAELLAKLENEPGFTCGWWQPGEGGVSAMLEGDAVEHAVACVRSRNATGLANCLSWLRAQRVHLGAEMAALDWKPTKPHRLADAQGSWWEWWSFFRNAEAALGGGKISERYRRSERDRLLWRWTHGGSRGGWPAGFGEALERSGLRREGFSAWVK